MRKCGVKKKEKRNALRNKKRKKMMKRNGNKKSKKIQFLFIIDDCQDCLLTFIHS
jgi:hypothetical protein